MSGFIIGAIQASPACEPEDQYSQPILESCYPVLQWWLSPIAELSVLGQHPRARTERSGWEVTPAISAPSQHPRLWIQEFTALFPRPAFVCFSSSSCSIQQPSLTTCPPCVEALAFAGLCKGKQSKVRPARASSYRLISTSCFFSRLHQQQQKRGGEGSDHVTMAPCSPPHKGEVTKTFSMMAGVGIRFHPEYAHRRKGRQSWAPQAAQTCRGRRVGRAPWEETGSRQG